MPNPLARIPAGMLLGVAVALAAALTWRVAVTGMDDLRSGRDPESGKARSAPSRAPVSEAALRERLARNPTDIDALVALSTRLEEQGRRSEAGAAIRLALRLAPSDASTLYESARYFMRIGDGASALKTLRKVVELHTGINHGLWPIFTGALESGQHGDFFEAIARENPSWWPGFFGTACNQAESLEGIRKLVEIRAASGIALPDERRCMVEQLQRRGEWAVAQRFWRDTLPADQKQLRGNIFNGQFELPLSNLGFDWLFPAMDGVKVTTESAAAGNGQRALHVSYFNKRYTGPPVRQYLLLAPGKYRFDGRARADGLNSWLGMQWGLYCVGAGGGENRQLIHTDAILGTTGWLNFQHELTVVRDCPAQVLRLELANPQRDARTAGNVAISLRGSVWFDDLRIQAID